MKTNASPRVPAILQDDRCRFLRHSLREAQVELSRLESPLKVIENTLLTAMGALGVVSGFNAMGQAEPNGIKVVGRGLDRAAIVWIEENFQPLFGRYFCALAASAYPTDADIRMLSADPDAPTPLTRAGIGMLVGWRVESRLTGLLGLGGKLMDAPFFAGETDFVYHLMDHMMGQIRAIAANAVMHSLCNELDRARQSAAACTLRNEAAKKDLEKTLFRLSGFNDIFHELSGLKESARVLDAFLLVMLGIFSAQFGSVLYWDSSTRKAHTAMRGLDDAIAKNIRPEIVRDRIAAVFGPSQRDDRRAMQVSIMPVELLKTLDPILPGCSIAILFKVDPAARGVLGLGQRLIETQYGANEQELLLAFTQTFLAFLKSSRSFETIERLNVDLHQKNVALEKTVQALSESRSTIAALEKAGERIKTAVAKAMTRTHRASVMDVALILIAGTLLGLAYNFASPSGIPVIPSIWRHPPAPRIAIADAKAMLDAKKIILIDARPVEFYNQRHIRGALNLPPALFDFVYMMRFSQIDPEQPLVVYGRNISRHYDEEIAYQLSQSGHLNVSILNGGITAWQAGGLAVSP